MKVKTNLQKLIKVKSDVKISKLLIQLLWKKTVSKIGKINIFQTKMIPGEKDQRKYQYWSACKESRVRWPGVSGFCCWASDFCSVQQELFFCEIQITEGLQSILLIKKGFGASWNDLWASTYASYSLPEWQAVKLTFFAPWLILLAQAFYTKTK